jgi:hypothetical protein
MSVEVACPGCGQKLRAPEDRIGKKARCKKCNTHFRIPGPGDSVGEPQGLSALSAPDEDVPMALAAEDVSSLPSADPFDFSAPPAVKVAKPAPPPKPPAPPPAPPKAPAAPAAPARPAFGAARAKPPESPPPAPPPPAAKAPPAPPPPPPPAKKPAPEPLPLDAEDFVGDTPEPEPETAGSPFAFDLNSEPTPAEPRGRGRRRPRADEGEEDQDEPQPRRGRDRDEEEEDERPRYRDRKKKRDDDEPEQGERRYRRTEQKSSMLLLSIVMGLAAIGALVAAIIVYQNQRAKEEAEIRKKQEEKEKEQKEREQREKDAQTGEKEAAEAIAAFGKGEPPKKADANPPPKKAADEPAAPPAKTPAEPVVPKKKQPAAKAKGDTLSLSPSVPLFQFTPPAANPALAQKASDPPILIDAPPAKVKRVFPPADRRNNDAVVVWQSTPGFNGKGEKLTADVHSGAAGTPITRLEFDGDGKDAKCDVSPDSKLFAAAGPDDKISVWELAGKGKTKLLDNYDPYADRPDGKAAGLAAVFFTASPKQILTVSTAGAVDLHDTDAKKIVASATLPVPPTPNRVVLGRSVAADVTRTSIVLAVGGDVYQISTAPPLALVRQIRLGEVSRSLGVAVLGVPGRIAYAFETDGPRKERGLFLELPNSKPVTYRWPDAPGDPTGAVWAGPGLAVVTAEKGAVYVRLDDETKKIAPFAFAELALPNAPQGGTEDGHWYLTAAPGNPNQSVLVEISADALSDFYNSLEGKTATIRLNEKGLSK